jgi:hypothetical protein
MPRGLLNLLFGLTTFLGAFLLFQVQPLIGKYILPWFGGTPSVWTTCMVFFQVMLLVGYVYAHLSVRLLTPFWQTAVHVGLLGTAVVALPIVPAAGWVPHDASDPTLRILALLTVTVGVPYLTLAATGPMLQAWFSRVAPGRSPYRFYALSNLGSMLALLSYPVVVEPNLSRIAQANLWAVMLRGFAIVCGGVALVAMRGNTKNDSPGRLSDSKEPRSTRKMIAAWVILPALASATLLAVTNKLCQDIAVVPLLWVVPLAIYLMTFIICFDNPRWYFRQPFIVMSAVSVTACCWTMTQGEELLGVLAQLSIFCFMLFCACIVYHGELVRLRPPTRQLTLYYLMIALGGAVGGILVAVVAPLVFSGYFELHASMLAAMGLALLLLWTISPNRSRGRLAGYLALGGVIVLAVTAEPILGRSTVLAHSRNFYGVLTVYNSTIPQTGAAIRVLQHGGTIHGKQFLNEHDRLIPTTYYGINSGVGLTLRHAPRRQGAIKVGAVGLGAGTVAVYAREGDEYKFYEINPQVIRLAREYFTFLRDCKGSVQIIPGDARISLSRETEPENFDVLILDAFSGDAIPVHLLTRESFELYLHHLHEGGIIAVHVSNRYLDLVPVVRRLAEHFRLLTTEVSSGADRSQAEELATWMILTSNAAWINSQPIATAALAWTGDEESKIRLWTDDDTNLFQILSFNPGKDVR